MVGFVNTGVKCAKQGHEYLGGCFARLEKTEKIPPTI